MQIEAGKYYKTRDGRKVGPIVRRGEKYDHAPWTCGGEIWFPNGQFGPTCHPLDIIAEWTEGPVRTVTRREIVPGVYGSVVVEKVADVGWNIRTDRSGHGFSTHQGLAADLRAAAATFLELAEALEDV